MSKRRKSIAGVGKKTASHERDKEIDVFYSEFIFPIQSSDSFESLL